MAKEMAMEATEKIKLVSRGEPVFMMGSDPKPPGDCTSGRQKGLCPSEKTRGAGP